MVLRTIELIPSPGAFDSLPQQTIACRLDEPGYQGPNASTWSSCSSFRAPGPLTTTTDSTSCLVPVPRLWHQRRQRLVVATLVGSLHMLEILSSRLGPRP